LNKYFSNFTSVKRINVKIYQTRHGADVLKINMQKIVAPRLTSRPSGTILEFTAAKVRYNIFEYQNHNILWCVY